MYATPVDILHDSATRRKGANSLSAKNHTTKIMSVNFQKNVKSKLSHIENSRARR